jgi:hypothetical protein
LTCKGRDGPKRRKSAVVPTKSIFTVANVPIIGGHHILALQSSPEGWQATPLLECCREHADRPGASGLCIGCSEKDQFNLLYGARRFVRRLNELGIAHRYEEFPDNHSGVDYRMDESLPFLARALTG